MGRYFSFQYMLLMCTLVCILVRLSQKILKKPSSHKESPLVWCLWHVLTSLHHFEFLHWAELIFFFHTGPRNYGKESSKSFSFKEYSQLTVNPKTSNNTPVVCYLVLMAKSLGVYVRANMHFMSCSVPIEILLSSSRAVPKVLEDLC